MFLDADRKTYRVKVVSGNRWLDTTGQLYTLADAIYVAKSYAVMSCIWDTVANRMIYTVEDGELVSATDSD